MSCTLVSVYVQHHCVNHKLTNKLRVLIRMEVGELTRTFASKSTNCPLCPVTVTVRGSVASTNSVCQVLSSTPTHKSPGTRLVYTLLIHCSLICPLILQLSVVDSGNVIWSSQNLPTVSCNLS